MKSLLPLLILLLVTPFVAAQTLDADITLGNSFDGRVDDVADIDVLRFDTVKNMQLTVTVKGLKDKENPGNPALLPQVEVLDLGTGDSLAIEASGGKKSAVKKLLLPSTGEYLIRISGTSGTSGPYKVKTKGKLSKEGKSQADSAETDAAAEYAVTFDADAGYLLTATIKPAKKSPAQPSVPTLMGPEGPIDISGVVVTNAAKFSHKLKKLPLPAQGTYTLRSTNEGTEAGAVFAKLKIKPTKGIKDTVVEPETDSGVSIVRTISGIVQNSNDGSGLPGVLVCAGDVVMATTDSEGRFMVYDPPTGDVEVHLDGSSTTAKGDFGELTVMAQVSAVGETVLPPVTLPDLSNPDSAVAEVATTAGATTEPIFATGAAADIALGGPTGTTIMIDGAPAVGAVDFNVTPVDPTQVPMPLVPASGPVDAASFVTISPANGTFDNGNPGTDTGLNVVLPNDRGFPVGTVVEIWSFDHDVNEWVNRSEQTGQFGLVVDIGGGETRIEANGVVTAGGWHAPVVPVDTDCATKITGRVVDALGQPIPDAAVGSSTGQFATTGTDGVFCLQSVTAYDASQLTCTVADVDVNVLTPVSYGAVGSKMTVMSGFIVSAGTTDIGDIMVTVPDVGSLAGLLIDNGQPVMDIVDVSGPDDSFFEVMSNENGSFFMAGLDSGAYIASYLFDGDAEATTIDFAVEPNALTTINLQRVIGAGVGGVTVIVQSQIEDSGDDPFPVQGAQVLLIGTDPSSQAGLSGTTDVNGEVEFENVDGPFTVTAQIDRVVDFGDGPQVARFAHTLVDIDPPTGVIGIFDEIENEDDSPTVDAMISGTITNIPAIGPGDFLSVQADGADFSAFANADTVTGAYTLDVPAGDYVVTFNHATGVTQNENRVYSAQFAQGVTVAAAGNTTVDFDMNSGDAIDFDQQIDLAYTGLVANPAWQVLQVPMFLNNGDDINLATFVFDNGALPDTVFVPDANDSALLGMRISVLLEQELATGVDDGVSCDVFLDANPASVSLDLPPVPSFLSPIQDAQINTNDALDMTVSFQDAVPAESDGVMNLELFSEEPQVGVDADFIIWRMLLRAGTTSVQLPATVLPMIGSGAAWEACLESNSFDGIGFDYDAFFDANVADSIAAIDGTANGFCESYAVVEFSID